ncbi:hypothetical protein [Streptomyces sp. NRRL S-455]|uniref:hypothetical protein n=1 Tax=Streptomyces sp. NRRL S-455 TaxID=1463908 RepID=UPI00131A5845|nr:hypothetical protein [Streptomyces sp. NRRL S-455]
MCVPVWTGRSGGRIWRGALAAALFHRALEAYWLVDGDGSRVVRLTDQGGAPSGGTWG